MKFVQHYNDDDVSSIPVIQFDMDSIDDLNANQYVSNWTTMPGFKEFNLDKIRLIAVFEDSASNYGMVVGYIFGNGRETLNLTTWSDLFEIRNSFGESLKYYTVYWRDGTTSPIRGRTVREAIQRAGFDNKIYTMWCDNFIEEGNQLTHWWDSVSRNWVRKCIEPNENQTA